MHISQKLFKTPEGSPLILTKSQIDIFDSILYRKNRRVQVIAPTQYGKSMTVGCALDFSAAVDNQRYAIVTGSLEKSMIIMRQCTEHIFDNPVFISQLSVDVPLERLKRERSKERLTFKGGGEIAVFTAQAKFKSKVKDALMGFGSPNVIEDESCLIDDDLHSMVMRMLGGDADNFLLKIGNPFRRNHFQRSWLSNRYYKIFIDYKIARAEGRYTDEFIEEMRNEAFFSVLYECKFPEADEMDERGYRTLLTPEQIKEAMSDPIQETDRLLGSDIGAGSDLSTFIIRGAKYAFIKSYNKSSDTMQNVVETEKIIQEDKVKASDVFIDDIGVGKGVTDRLKEKNIKVNAISVGMPSKNERYANLKAEAYWELRKWILNGGKLSKDDRWMQLAEIKYKVDTDKRLKIEPKEELFKRGIKSPDFAEGLMLTFTPRVPQAGIFI